MKEKIDKKILEKIWKKDKTFYSIILSDIVYITSYLKLLDLIPYEKLGLKLDEIILKGKNANDVFKKIRKFYYNDSENKFFNENYIVLYNSLAYILYYYKDILTKLNDKKYKNLKRFLGKVYAEYFKLINLIVKDAINVVKNRFDKSKYIFLHINDIYLPVKLKENNLVLDFSVNDYHSKIINGGNLGIYGKLENYSIIDYVFERKYNFIEYIGNDFLIYDGNNYVKTKVKKEYNRRIKKLLDSIGNYHYSYYIPKIDLKNFNLVFGYFQYKTGSKELWKDDKIDELIKKFYKNFEKDLEGYGIETKIFHATISYIYFVKLITKLINKLKIDKEFHKLDNIINCLDDIFFLIEITFQFLIPFKNLKKLANEWILQILFEIVKENRNVETIYLNYLNKLFNKYIENLETIKTNIIELNILKYGLTNFINRLTYLKVLKRYKKLYDFRYWMAILLLDSLIYYKSIDLSVVRVGNEIIKYIKDIIHKPPYYLNYWNYYMKIYEKIDKTIESEIENCKKGKNKYFEIYEINDYKIIQGFLLGGSLKFNLMSEKHFNPWIKDLDFVGILLPYRNDKLTVDEKFIEILLKRYRIFHKNENRILNYTSKIFGILNKIDLEIELIPLFRLNENKISLDFYCSFCMLGYRNSSKYILLLFLLSQYLKNHKFGKIEYYVRETNKYFFSNPLVREIYKLDFDELEINIDLRKWKELKEEYLRRCNMLKFLGNNIGIKNFIEKYCDATLGETERLIDRIKEEKRWNKKWIKKELLNSYKAVLEYYLNISRM